MKTDKLNEDEEHSHEFPNKELDPYPAYDMGMMSGVHGGDTCPRCGGALKYTDTAIRFDGMRGEVIDLAEGDVTVPVYHAQCWVDRQTEIESRKSTELGDFTDYDDS